MSDVKHGAPYDPLYDIERKSRQRLLSLRLKRGSLAFLDGMATHFQVLAMTDWGKSFIF